MDGFLACHLVLSKRQVGMLFLLVAKHAKARLRNASRGPTEEKEPQHGIGGGQDIASDGDGVVASVPPHSLAPVWKLRKHLLW